MKTTSNVNTSADVANSGADSEGGYKPDAHQAQAGRDGVQNTGSKGAGSGSDTLKDDTVFVEDPQFDEPDASSQSDIIQLLEQSQLDLTEVKDRYTRLQAEWDNYRKRTAAERQKERLCASANLVEQLLPVVDDLERAYEHAPSSNVEQLTEGIKAVSSKLLDVLNREGVKVIDPLDQPFDALCHQAVARVEDPGVYDETVKEVYQKGYEMSGQVLRTAMVAVSAGGPHRPTEPVEDEQTNKG
jgi:molecular chaperone GrpE